MPSLVTRFHLLLFGVTLAIAGVVLIHVPADYAFPAHWQGSRVDWAWPRNVAVAIAPAVQLVLMAAFFLLGRALTKNHLAKTRHILDPALTLLLAVSAGCQLGLLVNGIGSDFDFFRVTAGLLAATLLVTAVVLFEAERHAYAGLRMPWSIPSDRAWRIVHRSVAIITGLSAVVLAFLSWSDPGFGPIVLTMGAVLFVLPVLAALITLATRRL